MHACAYGSPALGPGVLPRARVREREREARQQVVPGEAPAPAAEEARRGAGDHQLRERRTAGLLDRSQSDGTLHLFSACRPIPESEQPTRLLGNEQILHLVA